MADLQNLETTLGIKFDNQDLLREALTHRSFLNENPKAKRSNERLEFLGDSVLSILVSTELFRRFPDAAEGYLTGLRSNLVRAKTLSLVAKHLNLGAFLQMSRGEEKSGGRENPSLLANTFEAILGAIYLDQGLETTATFLQTHIFPQIPAATKSESLFDFKSRLQEILQEKDHVSPTYRVLLETGPDHAKTFVVGVFSLKKLLAKGQGKSKQEAEQDAARLALEGIKQ